MICIVLGQCMAGICTTFGGFIACQGVLFGIGLGCVSLSFDVSIVTDIVVYDPYPTTTRSMVRPQVVFRFRTYMSPMSVHRLINRALEQQAQVSVVSYYRTSPGSLWRNMASSGV